MALKVKCSSNFLYALHMFYCIYMVSCVYDVWKTLICIFLEAIIYVGTILVVRSSGNRSIRVLESIKCIFYEM